MKKRVLSMFMALALCLTLLPAPVRAAEDTPESGAIVQQERQEEISPAVSEQAGTNEEENGSEGDPQNTGTPDAGGAEDSVFCCFDIFCYDLSIACFTLSCRTLLRSHSPQDVRIPHKGSILPNFPANPRCRSLSPSHVFCRL